MSPNRGSAGKPIVPVPVKRHVSGLVMSSSSRLAWTGLRSHPNSAELRKSMGMSARGACALPARDSTAASARPRKSERELNGMVCSGGTSIPRGVRVRPGATGARRPRELRATFRTLRVRLEGIPRVAATVGGAHPSVVRRWHVGAPGARDVRSATACSRAVHGWIERLGHWSGKPSRTGSARRAAALPPGVACHPEEPKATRDL